VPINFIALLDLSSNRLAGRVPGSFHKLALFESSRQDLVGADYQPLPRLFNLSGNAFSGDFPVYVLTKLPPVVRYCRRSDCAAAAAVAGPDMQLACPATEEVRGQSDLSLLAGMRLECIESKGERVLAAEYLGGQLGDGGSGGGYYASRSGGGAGLAGGAVAGLVLGLLVLLAALAALAYFVGYKRYYKEQRARGFQKFEAAEAAAAAVKGVDEVAATRDLPV
jgi:hypothetical protein